MPFKLYAYLGGALAILALVSGLYLKGRHDAAERWRPKYEAAQNDARNWQASFTASEKARKTDQASAKSAVEAEHQACDARVREARKSATIIRGIVHAPVKMDGNCPARVLVPADRLRDALQPR
jgi:hypothetical protein